MKKALLISESSVYQDDNGEIIARGGGEVYFHNIGKSLLKMGIEPHVFAIQEFKGQSAREEIDGVVYERFPVRSRSSFKIFKYLRDAVKRSKGYDYVFVNQFTPHLVLPWVKVRKVGVVFDVYQLKGRKFWFKQYGFFRGIMGNVVEKFQLNFDKKYADDILTLTEFGEEKVRGVMGKKIYGRIHSNPFPINREDYISDRDKEEFMLFVGRFVDYKHPEHVLYALNEVKKIFPEYKAVFVAPRVEKRVLDGFKKCQGELGLSDEDVIVKEDCSSRELKELYAKAKIFVQPSYVEGQGIVILEALASSAPVVAYDLPVYKGMVENGVNSILIKKGFREGFSRACRDVLINYEYFQGNCDAMLENFSEEEFIKRMRVVVDC